MCKYSTETYQWLLGIVMEASKTWHTCNSNKQQTAVGYMHLFTYLNNQTFTKNNKWNSNFDGVK